MAKAKPKTTKPRASKTPKSTPSTDRDLIRDCMKAAFQIGGFNSAYKAECDGNSKNINDVYFPSYGAARKMLNTIAKVRARSLAGLYSKAGLAIVVIEDDRASGAIQEDATDFLLSLANDVRVLVDVPDAPAKSSVEGKDQ